MAGHIDHLGHPVLIAAPGEDQSDSPETEDNPSPGGKRGALDRSSPSLSGLFLLLVPGIL